MDLLTVEKKLINIRVAIEYSKIRDCKDVRIDECIQVCNYSTQCVIIKKFNSIVIYDVEKLRVVNRTIKDFKDISL